MIKNREHQVCSNCVMDTTDSLIQFDKNGMCDHCNNYYRNILPNWNPDEKGAIKLNKMLAKIKEYGQYKEYDCIIGISGGLDSSYLTYKAISEWGLRPLLIYVDTGWNLPIAKRNVDKIINGLNVPLEKIIINWSEMKDLQLAFLKSQIASQDVQDHAIFATLYNTATKNKIKYVLTGSNISTESIREPVEWAYANDLRNIRAIHKKFGSITLSEFPTCSMFKYKIYYRYIRGMHVVRPLDWIPYIKDEVTKELIKEFAWEPYLHKHYESLFTRFFEGYWLVQKFGFDKRKAHYSSLIVTGQMTREEALVKLQAPPYPEDVARNDLREIAKKLDLTEKEFVEMMTMPNKSHLDYKNNSVLIKAGIKVAKLLGIEKRNFR